MTTTATLPTWPKQYRVQARNGLHVRERPHRSARSLDVLPSGTTVTASRPPAGGWIPIEFRRDTAYVSYRYLLPASGPDALPLTPFAFDAWPTTVFQITQPFGARPAYYAQFQWPGHEGVDVAAPIDTPIFAVAAGTVLSVTDRRRDGRPSPYGWHVEVDHGDGWRTLYAHLADVIPVPPGQEVSAGQIIGYSGNTGASEGPHLHLTLRSPEGLPGWPEHVADPTPFLQPLLEAYRRQEKVIPF